MKKWLIILLLFPFSCIAQIYKYIDVEDGLSNRRVYSIQKDRKGYMWFLTHEGIDRYNGKEFKQYKLMDGKEEVNSLLNLNWLYIDTEGVLWEIGKKGKVYRYDKAHDTFELVYKLPVVENKDMPAPVSYSYIDNSHTIWLCCEKSIYLYDTKSQDTTEIANAIDETITDIAQIDETHFFIGTEKGIHYAELKQGTLSLIHCDKLDKIAVQINELYFDQKTKKLFIGTFQRGDFRTESFLSFSVLCVAFDAAGSSFLFSFNCIFSPDLPKAKLLGSQKNSFFPESFYHIFHILVNLGCFYPIFVSNQLCQFFNIFCLICMDINKSCCFA